MARESDERPGPPVDLTLLSVGEFGCRPGCALCCFATPAASGEEVRALVQRHPNLPLLPAAGGFRHIASRPEGGACELLRDLRCSAHDLRPFPCREYPITVHMGERLQASLVLSCPGVDPARLDGWGTSLAPGPVHSGLDGEVNAVMVEARRPATGVRFAAARRRWVRGARRLLGPNWSGRLADLRATLHEEVETLARAAPAGGEPPDDEEGLERLPLFFDENAGRIAIAAHPVGWAFLAMRESGGTDGPPTIVPSPPSSVDMEAPARSLLVGYLRYWIERDSLFGAAMAVAEPSDPEDLRMTLRGDLEEIASTVKGRGWARRRLAGDHRRELSRAAILEGIRATDADLLDRPGLGENL